MSSVHQFAQFADYPVIAAFSGRHISHEDFLKSLAIKPNDVVSCNQVHGGRVIYVDSAPDEKFSGDAMLTDKVNIPLAVLTADCLPVFLYEPLRHVGAMVHAGWRSTKVGILDNAIKLMLGKFKINVGDLLAGLGPCIRSCCYQVSQEFKQFFPANTKEKNGRIFFDLICENINQLKRLGVKEKNIFDAHICTRCCNDKFFSYRIEGERAGRMMSVIMLK